MIEDKIKKIQKTDEKNNNAEDLEMDNLEDQEQINEIREEETEHNKTINENKKEKEDKNKLKNKEKHNKQSKDKKIKNMKSTYDYELEVLNNIGIENDDFFIVE